MKDFTKKRSIIGLSVICLCAIAIAVFSLLLFEPSIARADSYTTVFIEFDKNGGIGGDDYIEEYDCVSALTELPSKANYTFAGYFVDETNDIFFDSNGAFVYGKEIDTDFYFLVAKWEVKQHRIMFNTMGGTRIQSKPIKYGDELPVGIPIPEKTGYSFLGFFDSPEGNHCYYDENMIGVTTWDKDVTTTVYAQWKANSYEVILDDGCGGNVEQIVLKYDETVEYFDYMTVPSRIGYSFGGYYVNPDGSGKQYYNAELEGVAVWDIANDTTLYARWTPNDYRFYLDKQGGVGGHDMGVAVFGDDMPSGLTAPEIEHYTFIGYFSSLNENAVKYYNADMTSANKWDMVCESGQQYITLYAKYELKQYKIVYEILNDDISFANNNPATYTIEDEFEFADTDLKHGCKIKWNLSGIKKGTYGNVHVYGDIYMNAQATDREIAVTVYNRITLYLPDSFDNDCKITIMRNVNVLKIVGKENSRYTMYIVIAERNKGVSLMFENVCMDAPDGCNAVYFEQFQFPDMTDPDWSSLLDPDKIFDNNNLVIGAKGRVEIIGGKGVRSDGMCGIVCDTLSTEFESNNLLIQGGCGAAGISGVNNGDGFIGGNAILARNGKINIYGKDVTLRGGNGGEGSPFIYGQPFGGVGGDGGKVFGTYVSEDEFDLFILYKDYVYLFNGEKGKWGSLIVPIDPDLPIDPKPDPIFPTDPPIITQ